MAYWQTMQQIFFCGKSSYPSRIDSDTANNTVSLDLDSCSRWFIRRSALSRQSVSGQIYMPGFSKVPPKVETQHYTAILPLNDNAFVLWCPSCVTKVWCIYLHCKKKTSCWSCRKKVAAGTFSKIYSKTVNNFTEGPVSFMVKNCCYWWKKKSFLTGKINSYYFAELTWP